jgi:hypothetical protein
MVLQMLKLSNAPSILAMLVAYLLLALPASSFAQKFVHFEAFAGHKAVTKAWWNDGYAAVALDIVFGPHCDILSPLGFAHHVHRALQLDFDSNFAAATLAPVCSNFVFLSSGTTQRSLSRPRGNTNLASVRQANVMHSRVVLLCWLLMALGVLVILEQPVNSFMEIQPRFQQLAKQFGLFRKAIKMKNYGGASVKPTWLYCNYDCLDTIDEFMTEPGVDFGERSLCVSYTDKRGKTKVMGGKDLKNSQHYPRPFGVAIRKMCLKHKAEVSTRMKNIKTMAKQTAEKLTTSDPWNDADMEAVWAFLGS